MDLQIRQKKDRNGKLYEVTFNGQIVGDADDSPSAEWLRDTIAAAFKSYGELTFTARKAVEAALREVRMENVCGLYWGQFQEHDMYTSK